MLSLDRVFNEENGYIIYHYKYGSLLSVYNEKMFVFHYDDVNKKVFNEREKWTTYDFAIHNNKSLVGIVSLRDVDYENRKAKLFITINKEEDISECYRNILDEIEKFAFGNLNLMRLEGFCENAEYKSKWINILLDHGYQIECIFDQMDFFKGKETDILYFGKLREAIAGDKC